MTRRSLFLSLGLLVCSIASAQQACPPLEPPVPDPAKLLFTPKQETELGEIFRQQFESDFQVIEDTQVTAYVDRVGQGLARHLPDTGIHFEFLLYDRPEIVLRSRATASVFAWPMAEAICSSMIWEA